MKKKLILASASPRRVQLLKKIVKNFKVIPSRLQESELSAKTREAFAAIALIPALTGPMSIGVDV